MRRKPRTTATQETIFNPYEYFMESFCCISDFFFAAIQSKWTSKYSWPIYNCYDKGHAHGSQLKTSALPHRDQITRVMNTLHALHAFTLLLKSPTRHPSWSKVAMGGNAHSLVVVKEWTSVLNYTWVALVKKRVFSKAMQLPLIRIGPYSYFSGKGPSGG